MIYQIIVEGKTIPLEGKKTFVAFDTYDNKGKKSSIVFTRACDNRPTEAKRYAISVDQKDINRDKTSKFAKYYIRNLISCKEVDEILYANKEDLPFNVDDNDLPF